MSRANRLILLLSCLLGGLFSSAEPAAACSCGSAPARVALERATAVFAGTVVNINLAGAIWMKDPVQVTFQVSRVWKGPIGQQVTIATAASSASCGYEFRAGGEYLVYAGDDRDHLTVSLCSRTNWVAAAKEDLEILGVSRLPSPSPGGASGYDAFGFAIPILAIGLAIGLAMGVGLTVFVSRNKVT